MNHDVLGVELAAEAARRLAVLRDLYNELAHDLAVLTCRREVWARVEAEQAALAKLTRTT